MFHFWARIFTANPPRTFSSPTFRKKSAKEWGTLSFYVIQIDRKGLFFDEVLSRDCRGGLSGTAARLWQGLSHSRGTSSRFVKTLWLFLWEYTLKQILPSFALRHGRDLRV